MNTDVISPCGGYLPVFIDRFGYIKLDTEYRIVHRETRNLHLGPTCCNTLAEAKGWQEVLGNDEHLPAVLELTGEGGGAAVWVRPELRVEVDNRLARFKGCYGAWPTRTFSA